MDAFKRGLFCFLINLGWPLFQKIQLNAYVPQNKPSKILVSLNILTMNWPYLKITNKMLFFTEKIAKHFFKIYMHFDTHVMPKLFNLTVFFYDSHMFVWIRSFDDWNFALPSMWNFERVFCFYAKYYLNTCRSSIVTFPASLLLLS